MTFPLHAKDRKFLNDTLGKTDGSNYETPTIRYLTLERNNLKNFIDDPKIGTSTSSQLIEWWIRIAVGVRPFSSFDDGLLSFNSTLVVPQVFLALERLRELRGVHRTIDDVLVDMMNYEMVDLLKNEVTGDDTVLLDTIRWYNTFHFLVYVAVTFPTWSALSPMDRVFADERMRLSERTGSYIAPSTLTKWRALEQDMQAVWFAEWSKKNLQEQQMLESLLYFRKNIWGWSTIPSRYAVEPDYLITLRRLFKKREGELRKQLQQEDAEESDDSAENISDVDVLQARSNANESKSAADERARKYAKVVVVSSSVVAIGAVTAATVFFVSAMRREPTTE